MPELLLEIFSEEIPARMQGKAAADLERLVNERLLAAGFMPEGVKAFATPRRLALVAAGLPGRQPDRKEEKKGPRVGAPEKAVEGFLKSAGLASLDQCEIRDDKKGQYYVAVVEQAGRNTAAVIAEFVPEIIRAFPWPKSMRWGDGELRWVRPLKSILCCFDGEIVHFDIDGIQTGDATHGHRFMAPAEIRVRNFESYYAALKKAKVILDAEERRNLIAGEAKTLVEAQGLELVEDQGLLNEVAGLAEWPVVMIGSFDAKFLAVPDEALTASMRGHQKYFSVKDPKTGRLANKFVYVANIEAPDGGASMRTGYERVLTARLSDAWYLYQQDLKTPLKDRIADLDRVTFFEGLGSVGDKARRIAALAKEIAPSVGADPALAEEAALLAKADLVTSMVYEFPELQGLMGRYYFLAQNAGPSFEARPDGRAPQDEDGGKAQQSQPHPEVLAQRASKDAQQIADAIRDHYKPAGADDDVPTAPVSVAVALADKIDTLTAFWAIGKKPTGSSDPFALRRAALGVIKLVLENDARVWFVHATEFARNGLLMQGLDTKEAEEYRAKRQPQAVSKQGHVVVALERNEPLGTLSADLFSFLLDRLEVYVRDLGFRYDAFNAVREVEDENDLVIDNIVLIVARLKALEAFLKSDDGANLAAGFKRAANILKAEEKNDGKPADPSTVNPAKFALEEEKALYAALEAALHKAKAAVEAEKFEDAMAALASLRKPIDAFFDKVTVNDKDAGLRANRLALLARFRAATAEVADLSKLEG
ncbi:MAG TPA: glycine--tRNA ligase subunit beta [Parvularculaceae bacterium]|nr:glycine--tRNA ligase subunit beta [Parvularculaceae bacterium]HPE30617.1 glycine--tRNA ligase subunit beta [Parvularculaceae bacterium]